MKSLNCGVLSLVFIGLFLLENASAQIAIAEECKDIAPDSSFDIDKFLGRWYLHGQAGRPHESCVTFDFAKPEFYLEIVRYAHYNSTSVTLRDYGLGAPAQLPNTWNRLNIHFHKMCDECQIWYIRDMRVISISNSHQYQALLYACLPVSPTKYPHICADEPCSEVTVWLLKRSRDWPSRERWLNYARSASGLSDDELLGVDQEDCPDE